ncbi:Interferon alpha-inducible protein 27-like protein 2 [Phytophthora palmivora]|uniref:Interferon alpha-inducible protein 27-like protein 2 n=1 Tax=Phytophthora palmivora TaxID=4796 RepID=A0A2P4YHC5_9STRA|nr:Interferon alpha-inducible protein 27-like protein 2 [Phytophthora palmivora]
MSKKAASSCNSATPSVATRDPEAEPSSSLSSGSSLFGSSLSSSSEIATSVTKMMPEVTTGIWGGSTAASLMSAAAVGDGGAVAIGSVVEVMQSVGAAGLATPVGLGLVAGGAAIGGAAFLVKSRLSGHRPKEGEEAVEGTIGDEDEHKGRWELIEISSESGMPNMHTFDDD